MLQNLDYIYKAMYALDMWDKLNSLFTGYLVVFGCIILGSWAVTLLASADVDHAFSKFWGATKWWQIGGAVLWVIVLAISTIMPSKNTVKAYIGVKAAQAVGNYLDKETDIPERSKATITKLWDKVDSYIETIDTEDAVKEKVDAVNGAIDNTKVKADSIVEHVKSKVGEDQVNKLVEATRKQVVDSLMATMKK